jgi:deoxyadenosine/deoxycytidine kinase
MFYLLHRHRQQKEFSQGELFAQVTVADYLFERDRVFAYLALSDDELALYEQLYRMITRDPLPRPDLVVYLQASTEKLVSRLRARGRLGDKGVTPELLEELGKAYNEFFFNYSGSPLLVVNTSDLDIAGNQEDLGDIIQRALNTPAGSGTQYYTPKK